MLIQWSLWENKTSFNSISGQLFQPLLWKLILFLFVTVIRFCFSSFSLKYKFSCKIHTKPSKRGSLGTRPVTCTIKGVIKTIRILEKNFQKEKFRTKKFFCLNLSNNKLQQIEFPHFKYFSKKLFKKTFKSVPNYFKTSI
jgi:hypothetical protein